MKHSQEVKRKPASHQPITAEGVLFFYLLGALPQEGVEGAVSVELGLVVFLTLPLLSCHHQPDHLVPVLSGRHLHHCAQNPSVSLTPRRPSGNSSPGEPYRSQRGCGTWGSSARGLSGTGPEWTPVPCRYTDPDSARTAETRTERQTQVKPALNHVSYHSVDPHQGFQLQTPL